MQKLISQAQTRLIWNFRYAGRKYIFSKEINSHDSKKRPISFSNL